MHLNVSTNFENLYAKILSLRVWKLVELGKCLNLYYQKGGSSQIHVLQIAILGLPSCLRR